MSDFLFPIIEIVLGVVLLFAGGEFFIQGAIFLSLILGIPQIVIGLTVVSLGTSSPELLVSLSSIFERQRFACGKQCNWEQYFQCSRCFGYKLIDNTS